MVENKHIYKYNLTFIDYCMKTLLTIQFRIIVAVAFFAFATFGLYAQSAGNLDYSFDIGEGMKGNSGYTYCSDLQSDGKILLGGDFSS